MKLIISFSLGFILVGLSILAFDSLIWGFIIGELLGFILLTIDKITDEVKE